MCDAVTLKKCENSLLEKKEEILDDITYHKETLNESDGGHPLPCFQSHMAEVGTDTNERTKSFFFASRDSKNLSDINYALERISKNNFGFCTNEECQNDGKIEDTRLLAMPTAHLCMVCDPGFPNKN